MFTKDSQGYRKSKKGEEEKICERCKYRQMISFQTTLNIWTDRNIFTCSNTGKREIGYRCVLMMNKSFPTHAFTENFRLGKNYTCDNFKPANKEGD